MEFKISSVFLLAAILAQTTKLATGCGGYFFGSGNITSPNYPSLYPNNINCTWTLAANPGQYISLRLLNLDTEYRYDYVEIYNDSTTKYTFQCSFLMRLSGPGYGDDKKTLLVGPRATVLFISDDTDSASGFQLEYTSVSTIPFNGCGGYLTGSGNITSPGYPGQYPVNSHCTWTFAANPGENIILRFIYVDIEHGYDAVYIYNGTATINADHCELVDMDWGRNSTSLQSTKALLIGPNATVKFLSDSSISAYGFQLEYTSVNSTFYTACGGQLSGSGNITSPNYPNFYPMNSRCTWTLVADAGQLLSVRIISLDTEEGKDYVYIYNGTAIFNLEPTYGAIVHSGHINSYIFWKPETLIGSSATVLFISDSSISAPGFQIEYASTEATFYADCGGYLAGSGNITSPNFPSFYPMNSRCTWTCVANPNQIVSLRILSFDIENYFDNIYVHNGTAAVNKDHWISNLLYRFSGSNYYRNLFRNGAKSFVIGPIATVTFISDYSISASGFQIEFTSVTVTSFADCGISIIGSGNITSPNYPNFYPRLSRCTWTLTANPGQFISLRAIHFDTEDDYDYVDIYNGTTTEKYSQSTYLNRYSGSIRYTIHPYEIEKELVIGPSVTVVFISDSSIEAPGFQIEYTSVTVHSFTDCGGSLVGSGNITSPNYPGVYPLGCQCTWTIFASPGQFIWLRLIYMDTEYINDYVSIYNETTTASVNHVRAFLRYTGDSQNYVNDKKSIIGPNATVVFISDNSISASGFVLEFASVSVASYTDCGSHLVGTGNFTSPNYPKFYPINTRCTWTLTANPGQLISLRIISLDTEWENDYVNIYNKTTTVNPGHSDYLYHFSGEVSYADYTKPLDIGPNVTVVFISDYSISSYGFQIEFTTINATAFTDCGSHLVGTGTFTSPNYPNVYPVNSRCTWTLTANFGQSILLRIISLDTEWWNDYVYIYNRTTTMSPGNSDYLYHFSGEVSYADYTKPLDIGPNVTVVFISDNSISSYGFQIEFTSINATSFTDCGGYHTGSGNITSPNYPSVYPLYSLCTWTLIADPGKVIFLRVIYLDTEYGYDHVDIYNGTKTVSSDVSNLLHSYSGRQNYYYERAKASVVGPSSTIVFISDGSISAPGFKMEYTSVAITSYTDCGGHLVGSGIITSPYYPDLYPENCLCTWTLTASLGCLISLKVLRMDIEDSFDYIYIYNASESLDSYKYHSISQYTGHLNYYGYNYNAKLQQIGPSVRVTFISDNSFSSSGFQIEYTSVNTTRFTDCGGYLVGSGNITSPNYPSLYPENCLCTWTLTASPGFLISLRVLSMKIEESFDYIYIYNASQPPESYHYNYISQFTGQWEYISYYYGSMLQDIGQSVRVTFISDGSISSSGFQIEYRSVHPTRLTVAATTATPCGGTFYGSGVISSPNYPLPYPDNSYCIWHLHSSPSNYTLVVQFQAFETESRNDVVSIYYRNGTAMRYSGSSLPSTVILGTMGDIIFTSDSSSSASGFHLTFNSTEDTATPCGGNFYGSGVISSPNYPLQYPANAHCIWHLRSSPSNYTLVIQFQIFETELKHDVVSIYYQNGTEVQYSGSILPPTILLGTRGDIIFTSDRSASAVGFHLTYTSIEAVTQCGGTFYGSGAISSPNYPLQYPANAHCTWHLRSFPSNYTLLIQFQTFETESKNDVVSIYYQNGTEMQYSGSSMPPNILLGTRGDIIFTSDWSFSAAGFHLTYNSTEAVNESSRAQKSKCLTTTSLSFIFAFWTIVQHF